MIIDTAKIKEGKEQLEIDILKFISSRFLDFKEEYKMTPNSIDISLAEITTYGSEFKNYMPVDTEVNFPNVLEQ